MICLDCTSQDRTTPAVGACTSCGSGICSAHARVTVHEYPQPSGPGIHTPHPVRALVCAGCAHAIGHSEPLLAQPAAM